MKERDPVAEKPIVSAGNALHSGNGADPHSDQIKLSKLLGPGLITGAADDDPSGIATYSQAGAQFGYSALWVMPYTYPLMAGIQAVCARIGRVTGHGIAANIRKHYSKPLLYSLVSLMVIANTINIGADLGAMGDSLTLVTGGSFHLWTIVFALVSAGLQVWVPYERYVSILKWLTLALFSYVAILFFVHVDWTEVLAHSFIPTLSNDRGLITVIVAVLGTTISPYLFFWQASQEVEDVKVSSADKPLKRAPEQAPKQLRRIKYDTLIGMAFSNLISFFMIVTTAATLHAHHITSIQTTAQAAEALRPLAGQYCVLLFALGVIGTGMLAVPTLAGSAAYGIGESFRWRTGLENKPRDAKEFYAVLAVATIVGLVMNFTKVDPIKALFWTAVLNGIISVPLMIMVMLIGTNKKIMGRFTLPMSLRILGWLATLGMTAAAIAFFFTL